MTIIGIDIGAKGAIALLSPEGELIHIADMPVLHDGPKNRASVNAPLLAGIIYQWQASHAIVENVGPRPLEGAVGAFAFGRSRGVIEGVCAGCGVSIQFITPPTWKRIIGIKPGKEGAKDAARAEAIRRWPDKASLFARVKDDGRAEAALIGYAGIVRQKHK